MLCYYSIPYITFTITRALQQLKVIYLIHKSSQLSITQGLDLKRDTVHYQVLQSCRRLTLNNAVKHIKQWEQ